MSFPMLMLVGQAGSGKDTVAEMIQRHTDAELISLASPIKEFAKGVMGFTKNQLYGPSSAREEELESSKIHGFAISILSAAESRYFGRKDSTLAFSAMTSWVNKYFPKNKEINRFIYEWATTHVYEHMNHGGIVTARHVLQTFGTEMGRNNLGTNVWVDIAVKTAKERLESGATLVVVTDGRFRNEILAAQCTGGTVIKIEGPRQSSSGHSSETEQQGIPSYWFDYILLNEMNGLPALDNSVKEMLRFISSKGH